MRVVRGFARGSPGVSSGFWFEGVVGVYEGLAGNQFWFLGASKGKRPGCLRVSKGVFVEVMSRFESSGGLVGSR